MDYQIAVAVYASLTASLILGLALIIWGIKSLIFLISGVSTASLAVVLVAAADVPPQTLVPIGAVVFIVAGIVSLIYESYITIVLALAGAQIVFCYSYLQSQIDSSTSYEGLLTTFRQLIIPFVLISLLFAVFAVYLQKIRATRSSDNEQQRQSKAHLRRITYILVSIAAVGAITFAGLSLTTLEHIVTDLETELPSYSILGVDLISWPVLAVLTSLFVSWLKRKGYRYSFIPSSEATKYIYFTIFGLVAVPFTTLYMDFLFFGNLISEWRISLLWHSFPGGYYRLFIFAPWWGMAVKWAFSLVIFPGLVYLICLMGGAKREEPEKKAEPIPVVTTPQTPPVEVAQVPLEDTEQMLEGNAEETPPDKEE